MISSAAMARWETTSGTSFSQLKVWALPSAFAARHRIGIWIFRVDQRRAAGVFAVELGDHQPVLLGICFARTIVGEPAENGGNGLAVFHAPFNFGAGRIEGAKGLRRPALAARLRAKGNIAAQITFQIENIKSFNALAFPDAAFAVILAVVKLKGLAFLEVQVGIDAGYFAPQMR